MCFFKSRCLLSLCAAAVLAGALSSCRSPRDVTYFSELEAGTVQEINSVKDITVRPDDRLSILVVSKDPQLAALYNLPMMAHRVGQPGVSTSPTSGNNEVASYVVDQYGNIQFPQLGTLHIEGMRRNEVADYIREQLITRNQIKDPVVVVDFLNHGVTVLGEVNKPGRVNFDRDRFTILDAIAGAGDLTIQGSAAGRCGICVAQRCTQTPDHGQRQRAAYPVVLDLDSVSRNHRGRAYLEVGPGGFIMSCCCGRRQQEKSVFPTNHRRAVMAPAIQSDDIYV